MREVLADPPDEAVVLALRENRQRTPVRGGLVPEAQAGEPREELARSRDRHLRLGLRVDGDRVRGEDRDPYRRRGEPEVGRLEDLPRLVDELHLLPRVAVVSDAVDRRDEVDGDRVREVAGDEGLAPGPGERRLPKVVAAVH